MMSSRRGMTLLELVIALAIVGMAVSGGYAALASVTDQLERAGRATDATARDAAKRRTLIRWLEGARLDVEEAGPTFRGLDGVYDDIPDDEITFLTSAPTDVSAGRTVVRLYVDRDSSTSEQGLTAELSRWHATEVTRIEIAPDVEGLDCRFFSRTFGRAEWLPSWISGTVLPSAVEIELIPVQGDTLPRLLGLPIFVALEPLR